jgi:hypothetical protein
MGASRTFYITRDKAINKIIHDIFSLSDEKVEQILDLISDNDLLDHVMHLTSQTMENKVGNDKYRKSLMARG